MPKKNKPKREPIDAGANPREAMRRLRSAAKKGDERLVTALLKKELVQEAVNDQTTKDNAAALLWFASDVGSLTLVNAVLRTDNVDKKTYGETPLHAAVSGGFPEIVTALLNAGATVDMRDNLGETPLYKAVNLPSDFGDMRSDVQRSRSGIIKTLVEAGASADISDVMGNTPRTMAHNAVLRLLPPKAQTEEEAPAVSPSAQALAQAAIAALTVPKVLFKKQDVDLFNAALNNNVQPIQSLLNSGANPDVTFDDKKLTALHAAVIAGNATIIEVLATNGANINLKDGRGNTPLHIAAFKGETDTAGLLLKHGADVTATNNEGKAPGLIAAECRHSHVTRLLTIAAVERSIGQKLDISVIQAPQQGQFNWTGYIQDASASSDHSQSPGGPS